MIIVFYNLNFLQYETLKDPKIFQEFIKFWKNLNYLQNVPV